MIIFLDVDGVLNTVGSPIGILEPQLLELSGAFSTIRESTDLGIVLTSSWREARIDEFLNLTTRSDLGVSFRDYFIGTTPYLCTKAGLDPGKRSLEIQTWRKLTGYKTDKYVIIDDMPEWFSSFDGASPNFLQVNGFLGFDSTCTLQLLQKVKSL